jgi:glycosyltransferase involved in cell wall biosynthesis
MHRLIAVQIGARHNYAIPSILEQASMLEGFYTDTCADAGLGAKVNRFGPRFLRRGPIGRWLKRNVPANIRHKVTTFDIPTIRYLIRNRVAGSNTAAQHAALSKFGHELSRAMIRRGIGSATHVLSIFGEGTEFLEFARQKGLKIIVEVFITPLAYEIMLAEQQRYPDMEDPLPQGVLESGYKWFEKVLDVADVFIAPSEFVRDGLERFGVSRSRCHIVPYAVDASWLSLETQPRKGRILFVGTADLRKGVHYLGMAAQKLAGYGYEFRVAGGVTERIRRHANNQHLQFLGRVPRIEISAEYSQADVFVLPSLAEGSASVTYEALAVGLPVITTAEAGSVVRDSVDGFIVPARDPDALAESIVHLVENRETRDRLSRNAKERAKNFTWADYSRKLLDTIRDC